MLAAQNAARAAHGVAPLTWSNDLAALAQGFTDACEGHSNADNSSLGENLGFEFSACLPAVQAWLAEGMGYDPASGFNGAVLHFSQVGG